MEDARDDEHVPYLYEEFMPFGDFAYRNKASVESRHYEQWERKALAACIKERFTDTGGMRAVAVCHGDCDCF